jgi:Carboxylesterase family
MPSFSFAAAATAVLLTLGSVSGAGALRKRPEPGAAALEQGLPKSARVNKLALKTKLQELKARRPDATSKDAFELVGQLVHDAAAEEYTDLQNALKSGVAATVQVNTPLGAVVGIQGNGSNAFLGLPYAQPPVGALRWKAPQALTAFAPNGGVYNATAFQYVCPQPGKTWELFSPGQNEDCLYANIYAPQTAAPAGSGGWPVMIFFHGGSWVFGSGSFPLYWGTNDVSMLRNTVIITINYRLSVLGFLGGDALKVSFITLFCSQLLEHSIFHLPCLCSFCRPAG